MDDACDRREARRAAPLLLALLCATGMLPATLLPVIVTVAHRAMGFTTAQSALLGSIDIYGAALGALLVALTGVPGRWRRAATAAIAGLVAIDLGSMFVADFPTLLALRGAHGVVGGALTGIAYVAIARLASPDRGFGLLLVTQFLLGGIGTALLPSAVVATGPWLLFALFAGWAAAIALTVPLIGRLPKRDAEGAARAGGIAMPVAAMVPPLLALVLFQAGHTATSAFALEIARTSGMTLPVAQLVVGAAAMSGVLGAAAVSVAGARWGRLTPVLVAIAVGVAANLLLLAGTPMAFAIAAPFGAIGWAFSVPLVLAACASLDTAGRSARWASVAAKVGLASGPVAGAAVQTDASFTGPILLAILLSVAAGIALAAGRVRSVGAFRTARGAG